MCYSQHAYTPQLDAGVFSRRFQFKSNFDRQVSHTSTRVRIMCVQMSGVGCGPACRKIASNYTMDQYVNKAFEVLLDPETTKSTDGLFCESNVFTTTFPCDVT